MDPREELDPREERRAVEVRVMGVCCGDKSDDDEGLRSRVCDSGEEETKFLPLCSEDGRIPFFYRVRTSACSRCHPDALMGEGRRLSHRPRDSRGKTDVVNVEDHDARSNEGAISNPSTGGGCWAADLGSDERAAKGDGGRVRVVEAWARSVLLRFEVVEDAGEVPVESRRGDKGCSGRRDVLGVGDVARVGRERRGRGRRGEGSEEREESLHKGEVEEEVDRKEVNDETCVSGQRQRGEVSLNERSSRRARADSPPFFPSFLTRTTPSDAPLSTPTAALSTPPAPPTLERPGRTLQPFSAPPPPRLGRLQSWCSKSGNDADSEKSYCSGRLVSKTIMGAVVGAGGASVVVEEGWEQGRCSRIEISLTVRLREGEFGDEI